MKKLYKKYAKKYPFLPQLLKFGVAGVLNTITYVLVLSILSRVFDIYQGWKIFILTVGAFSIAVTQSYFINKKWTFKGQGKKKSKSEFIVYVLVTIIGQAINGTVVYLITTYVPPIIVGQELWVTLAGLFATGASMVWNFTGYKFFVFKKK